MPNFRPDLYVSRDLECYNSNVEAVSVVKSLYTLLNASIEMVGVRRQLIWGTE